MPPRFKRRIRRNARADPSEHTGFSMIHLLRGTLLEKEAGWALLDVNGVGYGIDMPSNAVDQLPEAGEAVTIHTYLHVREDAMILFGFHTPEEREAFSVFIQVSGIGPKTALGILAAISIDHFAQAIVTGDIATLTRIPGIGKKSAERIIVEMKDRIGRLPRPVETAAIPMDGHARQACEALMALGCKPAIAEQAVGKAAQTLGGEAQIEDLVREALKHR